jgi:hypothetical protein
MARPRPPVAPARRAVLPPRSMYGTYLRLTADLHVQQEQYPGRKKQKDEESNCDKADDHRGRDPSSRGWFRIRDSGRLRRVRGSRTRRDAAAGLETGRPRWIWIRGFGSHTATAYPVAVLLHVRRPAPAIIRAVRYRSSGRAAAGCGERTGRRG